MADDLRFVFVKVGDLLGEPRAITARDVELAYRKGYSQGYYAAVFDMDRLIAAGYMRLRELRNFLAKHADELYHAWRLPNRRGKPAEYLPPRLQFTPWADLRQRVLERDGRACVFCGATQELHVDHVLEVRNGGVAEEDNLRVLCAPCNWARNRKAAE